MYPIPYWDEALDGISDADIQSYIDDYGITPQEPSDLKLKADITEIKTKAITLGNTKLANTLDFILKYGDQALSILTKNGILKNQNLAGAGYSIDLNSLSTDTKDDSVSSAPDTSSRVFNLDFTDPKVLIITFLLVMILFYFLFFNKPAKNAKR